MPHVVPVAFRYNPDPDTIDIGGHDFATRKKFRDVKRTGVAALVVDDVLPPWQPRAVEVRGEASTIDTARSTLEVRPSWRGSTTRSSGSVLAGSSPGALRTASRLVVSADSKTPTAISVAWCSTSNWSAPDGPRTIPSDRLDDQSKAEGSISVRFSHRSWTSDTGFNCCRSGRGGRRRAWTRGNPADAGRSRAQSARPQPGTRSASSAWTGTRTPSW
jgi:PPOX class F420-dependent enzyme/OxyR family protein